MGFDHFLKFLPREKFPSLNHYETCRGEGEGFSHAICHTEISVLSPFRCGTTYQNHKHCVTHSKAEHSNNKKN